MLNLKYIIIVVFILLLAGIFIPPNFNSEEQKLFLIEKGEGLGDISTSLKEEKLINSSLLFRLYAITAGMSGNLKSGAYLFSPSMNIFQIAGKIGRGEIARTEITIPEGFTSEQISDEFSILPFFIKNVFLAAGAENYAGEFDFLSDVPEGTSLEGFLFPDTYKIDLDENSVGVIRMMLNNFNKKLTAELRGEIKDKNKTIFDTIIMASLLEREVKTFEDKQIVSGILWKRLKNGVPLQIDATVNYITGKNSAGVSIEDTKIDSPYNTYKYRGLPVGPISNPGIESIIAAMRTVESEYWFYLSAPDGRTIFSATLEEHAIARAKYLK
ncbi:MAG: endolytic transglycosylase MltG [Candidatus Parcubacteria bacterium]|nr:endolytic transglycosylase MltG [Candidatus Parcubacteria bacterium]